MSLAGGGGDFDFRCAVSGLVGPPNRNVKQRQLTRLY